MPRVLLFLGLFPLFLSASLPVCVSGQDNSLSRVWKDKTGRFRLEATFDGVAGDKVRLRRKDDSRIIEVPLANLGEADVEFIRARGLIAPAPVNKRISTADTLETAAQRRRFALDALAMYDQFLSDAAIADAEKIKAKKAREQWVIAAAVRKVRVGTRWFTPAEYLDLVTDEHSILETAHDFSIVSDPSNVEKKLEQAAALNQASITADFVMGIGHALFMDRKRRSAAKAEEHFGDCIRRLNGYEQDLTEAERANLAACYNNRALALLRQRKYSEALRVFEQCLNAATPSEVLLHNLGQFQAIATDSKMSRQRDDLSAVRLTLEEKNRLDRLCSAVPGISRVYERARGWRYMRLAHVDEQSLLDNAALRPNPAPKIPPLDLVEAGGGTGFVVGPGFVATNRHVTDGGVAYTVRLDTEEREAARRAQFVAASSDPKVDVAVLKCDNLSAPAIGISADIPALSTEIHTLGFPRFYELGTAIKVSRGIITAVPPLKGIVRPEFEGCLMHDAVTARGSSGGPIFNQCGLVIGVHTAAMFEDFKLGIPAPDAGKFLELHVPGLRLKSAKDVEIKKWEEAVASVRASTVHVLVMRQADRFNAILEKPREARTASYDDRTCMACYGTNLLTCTNRQCDVGTVMTYRDDVITLPGGALKQNKRTYFRVPCSNCKGRGSMDCPYCSGGYDPRFK